MDDPIELLFQFYCIQFPDLAGFVFGVVGDKESCKFKTSTFMERAIHRAADGGTASRAAGLAEVKPKPANSCFPDGL